MKVNKEVRRFARELFLASFTDGRLDAAKSKEVSDKLVAAKPRGYFQILREYTRLVRLELDRRHAVVESATDLDAAELSRLKTELPSQFGQDITMEFRTNPTLLGGLRIQVGGDVWDGSVSSRLAALTKQL